MTDRGSIFPLSKLASHGILQPFTIFKSRLPPARATPDSGIMAALTGLLLLCAGNREAVVMQYSARLRGILPRNLCHPASSDAEISHDQEDGMTPDRITAGNRIVPDQSDSARIQSCIPLLHKRLRQVRSAGLVPVIPGTDRFSPDSVPCALETGARQDILTLNLNVNVIGCLPPAPHNRPTSSVFSCPDRSSEPPRFPPGRTQLAH